MAVRGSSSIRSTRRWRRSTAPGISTAGSVVTRSRNVSPQNGWRGTTWRFMTGCWRRDGAGTRRVCVSDLVEDPSQYYIVASRERRDDRTRVLKHADTFAVFDAFGDIGGVGPHEQGLYHEGTRHISTCE